MRRSVSSPVETPRRQLKIRRAAEYFWRTSRCFIWWWNTVSNVWYYFSNKMILEGEIKDAKMSSFSSDFQALIKHWCSMSDVRCLMSDIRCPDVRCPMSDVRCPMSDVRCLISDVRCPMSDVRCSDLPCPMSDVYVRCPMLEVPPRVS